MSVLQILGLIILIPLVLKFIGGYIIGILCAIWYAIFEDDK